VGGHEASTHAFLLVTPSHSLCRIDFSSFTGELIVECPTAAHEVADKAYNVVVWGPKEYWPDHQGNEGALKPPHLDHRGQTTLALVNGRKSADFSLVDCTPGLADILAVFPTIVWEVAYTQTSRELAEVCARWIACSLGRVLLAVGIDIVEGLSLKTKKAKSEKAKAKSEKTKSEKTKSEKTKSEKKKECTRVDCILWELVESETLPSVPEGETLNKLVRCDGLEDNFERVVSVAPGTKYYCISGLLEGGKKGPPFIKYVAGVTRSFQVSFTL
jgi:hypothetical protein